MENLNQFFAENLSIFLLVIFVILAILLILLILQNARLNKLLKNQKELFAGGKAVNLESVILEQGAHLKQTKSDIQEIYALLKEMSEVLQKSIKKTGLVRFNPFPGIGGNQSFAIALLDSVNNGLVLSSLHSRESTRVYAKSIKKGVSEYQLTEEEQEALFKAINSQKSLQK